MLSLLLRTILRATAFLAVGLAWMVAASPPAAAQGQPVLRERISVHADLVTLGDIFENAGPAAHAPVFRSPDLGTEGVVAAKRIAAAALKHGLLWPNPGGIEQVSVERPSRRVTLDEIRSAIAAHAAREIDIASAGDLTVTFERRARAFHVDSRVTGALNVKRLHLQRVNGVFDAVIGFEGAGSRGRLAARDRAFRGRVVETMQVAVPARPIERGATIGDGDVKITRLPASQMRAGMITERHDLAGMAAKRQLRADQPVRHSQVERPKLVRRNTLVTIIYEIPGLALKSQGRAQADASQGEAVAVLNTRSNRTVQATVRGPGVVVVGAPASPAAPQLTASLPTQNRRAELIGPQPAR